MITDFDLGNIAFIIGKVVISIFMLIHVLAILLLIRQASLAARVIVTEGNKRVLLFSYLHAIILILTLIVIVILPAL